MIDKEQTQLLDNLSSISLLGEGQPIEKAKTF